MDGARIGWLAHARDTVLDAAVLPAPVSCTSLDQSFHSATPRGEVSKLRWRLQLQTYVRCDRPGSDIGSPEATIALQAFIQDDVAGSYIVTLRHALGLQRRLRRDQEYIAPSVGQLVAVMDQALPESIDDVRAYFADRLETFQTKVRSGNTDMWQAFWRVRKPQTENIRRNRLVDAISGLLPPSIRFEPEMHMPGQKRADIAAIRNSIGLPVEIKGQWHPALWTAPVDQLAALYTRDWHARGRGVYLVLWFGRGVYMHAPPSGDARPTTPIALRQMLIERLPEERRDQIDVYVVDLSKPS